MVFLVECDCNRATDIYCLLCAAVHEPLQNGIKYPRSKRIVFASRLSAGVSGAKFCVQLCGAKCGVKAPARRAPPPGLTGFLLSLGPAATVTSEKAQVALVSMILLATSSASAKPVIPTVTVTRTAAADPISVRPGRQSESSRNPKSSESSRALVEALASGCSHSNLINDQNSSSWYSLSTLPVRGSDS